MSQRQKLLIVLAIDVAIAVLVARNVRSHAPVQPGTASAFWKVVCNIDVDESTKNLDRFGGCYPPQGEWAVYFIQGYNNQFLFRVRLSELAPYLDQAEQSLRGEANSDEPRPWLVNVSKTWRRADGDEKDVARLLDLRRQSYLSYVKEKDKGLYTLRLNDERDFNERWHRAGRYWLTVAFEFFWLSLVLAVAAFPWLCKRGRLAWATCLGLVLPLLFAPFFLGYVPYTFTSAFPAGGVFYPHVIAWFRGLPLFHYDIWLLEHAPQPFETLTQQPGPMLALTGTGLVGPIAICAIGVAVFVGVYAIAIVWTYIMPKFKPTKMFRPAI